MSRLFTQLIPHLVAFGLIVVCLLLSQWQDRRAAEKSHLLSQWENAPTLSVASKEELDRAPLFSKISLKGRFDPSREVLLDNKTRQNHPGLHVFTPFRLTNSEVIILVNRGWQPWLRHSGSWPQYPTPLDDVRISGRLNSPPTVGLRLGEPKALDQEQWPNLVTYFDIARLTEAFGPSLHSRVLLLEPEDSNHLSRDPWPSVNMTPERHRAYAFQWLAIALAIGIIWVALSYRFYWKKP